MSDGGIRAERRLTGRKRAAGAVYRTEMVSPICEYEDIEKIQELIREVEKKGAIVNRNLRHPSCISMLLPLTQGN